MAPVTLGRSDAILARNIIRKMLGADNIEDSFDKEEVENLLQFIEVQLNSIAENEEVRSPLRHIWRPM